MPASGSNALQTLYRMLVRVVFAILVLLFPAAAQAAPDSPPAQAAFSGQRLKTIIVDNYQPYTFLNEKGEPDGFSVEIARAVARVMDFELVITADTWEMAQKSLEKGDIDLLPMMAYSRERDLVFDFSVAHTIAYDTIFYRKGGASPRSLADLEGKTVLVMSRDAAHEYLLSSGLANKMRLQLVDSLPEALRQLALGNADAAIMPKLVGMVTAKKLNLPDIETSPHLIDAYTRPFSFAVREGNQALLERLNQGLNIIKTTGQYDVIYKKWFGELEGSRLDWSGLIRVMALAGTVLLAFLAWNISLNRKVKLKTRHLEAEIAQRKRSEDALHRRAETQAVLREIAEAAVKSPSLKELYRTVHQLVGKVLPSTLFHINLLDEAADEIVVPFRADDINFIPERRPVGKGMTEYIMRLGRAVHVTPERMEDLCGSGEYSLAAVQKVQPRHYLGAPLIDSKGRAFGVMSLITMGETDPFRPEDVEVLSIIAVQVSMAVERKQAEEELRESESKYRKLFEVESDALFLIDSQSGKILDANLAAVALYGYSRDELLGMRHVDLSAEPEKTEKTTIEAGSSGTVLVPLRYHRKKSGLVFPVEINSTSVLWQGRPAIIPAIRDITDRVSREQEIQRDARLATRVQNTLLSVPKPSEYLKIDTIYQPVGYVGGDLFFLDWRYDGSLLRGFLVDATGHGLGTALHTASLHVLLREVNERDLPLSDAMRWLNHRAGEYFDEGTFAGALGFEFDLQTRQLRWTCAGIPKTWISTQTQQGPVDCPGMCLGILDDETFDTHTLPIAVGDSFYFMTDGLAELLGRKTELPLDRYPEMVGLLGAMSEAADRRDDATAVCIQVRSLPQSLVRQDGWPRMLRFNGYGDYQRFKSEIGRIVAEVTGKPHSIQEVAVHEALANALECRDGVPRQHRAILRFNKVGGRLIVRVKTSRIGFAGNVILKRLRSHPGEMFAFGEDASMGRGIPMMLSMSHRMTYNSEGTEVLLAWKLESQYK